MNLGGYPIVLTDTAGIRRSRNFVEREGIERARRKLKTADILIVLLDAKKFSSKNFSSMEIEKEISKILEKNGEFFRYG